VTDLPRPHAHVHFGVFFQGVNHSTIWSDPASGSQTDFESFRQIVQTAERGLFDAFFLGEGLRLREQNGVLHDLDVVGRPDAITQLAALAAVTTHIGLAATQNVTYNDPADLARRLASLDLLSGGRAAWNIVTTDNAWTGENFRRGGWLDHDLRYVRAGEFVRAAQAIWDGTPGEPVTFAGQTLEIEVTPTVPRSPQGRPVIFQAGDSDQGREFAAAKADAIFSRHSRFADGQAFYADVKGRLAKHGRRPEDLVILPAATFILGDTAASSEPSSPKTWVAILDVIFGVVLVVVAVRFFRKTPDPAQTKAAIDRMSGLATSPPSRASLANSDSATPAPAHPALRQTSQPLGPMGIEWLARQGRALKRESP